MALILSVVVSFLVSLSTCFGFFLISKKRNPVEKSVQPEAPSQSVFLDGEADRWARAWSSCGRTLSVHA